MLVYRRIGVSVYRCIGVSVYRCIVYRCIAYRCIGVSKTLSLRKRCYYEHTVIVYGCIENTVITKTLLLCIGVAVHWRVAVIENTVIMRTLASVYWCIGVSVHWCTGVRVYRRIENTGIMRTLFLCTGVLVYWIPSGLIGVLVYWYPHRVSRCTGVLAEFFFL